MENKLIVSNPNFIEPSLLSICKDNKILFQIDSEGVITYTLNGELKKMDSEKELSFIFCQLISDLSGLNTLNKEEVIYKILESWRDNKIDTLLI
jgi:hypothetical protein